MTVNSIAIDGPAASGKSTLALKLADQIGFLFFDTGIMYRAVTFAALARGVDVKDEQAVSHLAETIDIDIRLASAPDGRTSDVLVDGEDCTWAIREPIVNDNVSIVAAYAGVRDALGAQQRKIGMRGEVVMVGRDIGTVILPEAVLKIYLDASAEERAKRRYDEAVIRGEGLSYEEILQSVKQRDKIDSSREIAPLKPADDAVIIDSDGKDIEKVFEETLKLVHARG